MGEFPILRHETKLQKLAKPLTLTRPSHKSENSLFFFDLFGWEVETVFV